MRAEACRRLFQMLFVDTPLVPHLFRLLRPGVAHFESASLLQALLRHVLDSQTIRPSLDDSPTRQSAALALSSRVAIAAEKLLPQYLNHIDELGDLLMHGASATALFGYRDGGTSWVRLGGQLSREGGKTQDGTLTLQGESRRPYAVRLAHDTSEFGFGSTRFRAISANLGSVGRLPVTAKFGLGSANTWLRSTSFELSSPTFVCVRSILAGFDQM